MHAAPTPISWCSPATPTGVGGGNREAPRHLGLARPRVGRFSDGEVTVEINQNVAPATCSSCSPTCAPTNEHLMELLIMVDALKRASAERISAVIPYFGYARQDRRPRSTPRADHGQGGREPARDRAASQRVLTMDLHADQIQGFFDIPVDNIYASPVLLADVRAKHYGRPDRRVSPDVGGVVRARALAKQLDTDLAIIDKRRPRANVSEVMHVIGEIEGRNCVIMDDMIDTAGTLVKAAEVLKERGAKQVYAYCTHADLLGPGDRAHRARPGARRSGGHQHDPAERSGRACSKIRQLSVAPLIAETIQRIANGRIGHESVFGSGKPVLEDIVGLRASHAETAPKPFRRRGSHWSRSASIPGVLIYEIRRF